MYHLRTDVVGVLTPSPHVNYYYKVMPFDLKNAEAMYHRVMDKIFKGLIE